MTRAVLLVLMAAILAGSARADEPASFDPKTASDEALVTAALRYGTTDRKRADKRAARDEIVARRDDGLRLLLSFANAENVGLSVFAQEMVETLPASNAVPPLVEALSSADTNTQRLAIYFLGFHRAAEHVKAIAPFLDDEKLRGATVRTLGKWGVRTYARRIEGFLASTNERLRVTSVIALEDMRATNSLPALVGALGDPVFTVRNRAQEAVVTFGKAAEAPLLKALPDALPPARRQIVRTLGEVGSKRATKPLRALLEDPDPGVRDDARRALDAIEARD